MNITTGSGGNVKHDLINKYENGNPRMAFSVKFADDPIVKNWFFTKSRDAGTAASNLGYSLNN